MPQYPPMPEEKKYKLVNAYEENVRKCVWETMQQMDMCTCEKCFLDAVAMVSNKGFARFATTTQGMLLSQIDDMNVISHAGLVVAVTAVLNLVKADPRH